MIKSYLKIAWRNIYKHRFYTLINVFGLAMGISCAIILFIFISYHLSFDKYQTNYKRIYRIVSEVHEGDGNIFYDQGSPLILGQTLKQQSPAVIKEAIIIKQNFTVGIKTGDQSKQNLFNEKDDAAFANNDLLNVFSYSWLSGDASTALTQPNTGVITATLAKKYFNTDEAVGKTIRLDDKYNVLITGVLNDNPKNTDIRADLFISLASAREMYDGEKQLFNDWEWVSSKTNVFVLLNNENSQPEVDNIIRSVTQKALGKEALYNQHHLQPLADVHFNTRYSGTTSMPLLSILTLVGFALLFIAGVNFVNMATAQSLTRAKEIGTRKVLGSSPKGIFWQFITETAYVAFAASALALLITIIFLPALNNWLQLPLAINANVFIFLTLLFVVVVFSAGFYPGVILSRFKPVNALKNIIDQNSPTAKLSRNGLIIIQNVIAQLLIVCTLIITLQVKFLKDYNIGFNKDAVIIVPVQQQNFNNLSYLRNALNNYPGVKSVSYCYSPPSAVTNKGGSIRYDGKQWENFNVNSIIGDENYLKTFGLKLLAGRNLLALDTTAEYLVNEQLLAKLNIKSPEDAIGHRLTAGDFNDKKGTIVGVVKDFNSRPLSAHIEPLLIAAQPDYYKYAAIKIAGNRQGDIINTIKQAWQKVYPENVFEYHFVDQQIADFYQKEEMINKLIKAGAIVGIFISCLGLLGLISLMTVQRTKEIGIRKVLGASAANITAMLSKDFLKLVLIGIVAATPIAWYIMNKWLQNFAYRINIDWWVFAIAGAIAILIAFFTVSFQSIKVALANPVDSLRSE